MAISSNVIMFAVIVMLFLLVSTGKPHPKQTFYVKLQLLCLCLIVSLLCIYFSNFPSLSISNQNLFLYYENWSTFRNCLKIWIVV